MTRAEVTPRGRRVAQTLLCGAAAWLLGAGIGASAVEVKTLAIMMPEEPTDYGWNQQGFEAAKAVAEKYGLKFLPATGLGYGDVHAELRELADDGASLIIAHAAGYNTAAPEIGAERHVPVAIVDRPKDSKPGAVADYTLSGHQGAYLAGVLAAETTQTKVLGVVVSGEPPSWNSQSAAFAEGARATDPGIRIVYAVIGPAAYSDAAGGRRVTESVIGAGADVIFGEGDGASFGMLQAVETRKSSSGGKVWFIDVIGDKTPVDKGNLLSSVVWNLVPVYSAMIEDLKAGRFGTHPYALRLADDSVRLLHTKHIPDKVWSDLEAVRRRIIDGSVKVEPVFDAARARALMNPLAAGSK
jgi:simple sugar transport system substrate-binding protein